MKISKGDKVKMSEKLKSILTSNGCEEHVIEFENCIGIVEERVLPDIDEATEVMLGGNHQVLDMHTSLTN